MILIARGWIEMGKLNPTTAGTVQIGGPTVCVIGRFPVGLGQIDEEQRLIVNSHTEIAAAIEEANHLARFCDEVVVVNGILAYRVLGHRREVA